MQQRTMRSQPKFGILRMHSWKRRKMSPRDWFGGSTSTHCAVQPQKPWAALWWSNTWTTVWQIMLWRDKGHKTFWQQRHIPEDLQESNLWLKRAVTQMPQAITSEHPYKPRLVEAIWILSYCFSRTKPTPWRPWYPPVLRLATLPLTKISWPLYEPHQRQAMRISFGCSRIRNTNSKIHTGFSNSLLVTLRKWVMQV